MRKVLVIALVLLFTLVFGPAAFAAEIGSPVLYGNAYSGGISYGSHGYSWYSEDGTGPVIPEMMVLEPEVVVKGIFQNSRGETGQWYSYLDNSGKEKYYFVPDSYRPVLVKGAYQDNSGTDSALIWDFDRDGQWEFYKDARGVIHYFYVDPDREGEYQRYTDENGVTQYVYQYND